jgi:hypothetical protein
MTSSNTHVVEYTVHSTEEASTVSSMQIQPSVFLMCKVCLSSSVSSTAVLKDRSIANPIIKEVGSHPKPYAVHSLHAFIIDYKQYRDEREVLSLLDLGNLHSSLVRYIAYDSDCFPRCASIELKRFQLRGLRQ